VTSGDRDPTSGSPSILRGRLFCEPLFPPVSVFGSVHDLKLPEPSVFVSYNLMCVFLHILSGNMSFPDFSVCVQDCFLLLSRNLSSRPAHGSLTLFFLPPSAFSLSSTQNYPPRSCQPAPTCPLPRYDFPCPHPYCIQNPNLLLSRKFICNSSPRFGRTWTPLTKHLPALRVLPPAPVSVFSSMIGLTSSVEFWTLFSSSAARRDDLHSILYSFPC